MAIDMATMIRLLNRDLALEYTAMVQYVQHSGVLTGAEYGDIIKEIKVHAAQEMEHAIILTEQIDFLEGSPTVDVPPARTSTDNRDMLEQDMDGELDAIARYKERILQAEEMQELALSQRLREILAVEQEYAMDLRSALGTRSAARLQLQV